ncbi:MAG: UDP-N-acetylmuramoyl-L-alanine--D-glutamate ligase [Actinomycetota bacterium]|nr:UDP-N-acetylmuramoyl-L-alanine--D-glutamate ligase [Actinomycetota bacterium]
MFLKGKNILVLGLGKTGQAVIKKMKPMAETLIALDDNAHADIGNIRELGVRVVLGPDARKKEALDDADIVIASPGIPASHPVIRYALEINVPVWSELELAWSLLPRAERKRTIAVTGTNGKTTVVNLLGHILKKNGREARVCGNVGDPLINNLEGSELYRVIEVSSFQLERSNSFSPHIGILLNISSDHIDRHGSVEQYAKIKFKLFAYQNKSSFCLLNRNDAIINRTLAETGIPSQIINYGLNRKRDLNLWYKPGQIKYSLLGKKGSINIEKSMLKGKHNISNILASVAAAKILNLADEEIEQALNTFQPLEHRLEYIGQCRGIDCYNDSKATNPHSTIAALENFNQPVTLVMGGKDKGMDLDDLLKVLNIKVSHLVLIGESKTQILKKLESKDINFKVYKSKTLKQAVDTGLAVTPKGGVFLLSPAFASMDMFVDYKDRGNQFRALVEERINDRRPKEHT